MNDYYSKARAARRHAHATRPGVPSSRRRKPHTRAQSRLRLVEPDALRSDDLDLITDVCPGYNLGKAYRRVSREFEVEFRAGELTLPQFALLVNIGRGEPATGTEVAERLGSDISTISRTIDALVRRGLVVQGRGTDRRVRVYRLTNAGRQAVHDALPAWHAAKRRVLATVDSRSWQRALRVLKQLGA